MIKTAWLMCVLSIPLWQCISFSGSKLALPRSKIMRASRSIEKRTFYTIKCEEKKVVLIPAYLCLKTPTKTNNRWRANRLPLDKVQCQVNNVPKTSSNTFGRMTSVLPNWGAGVLMILFSTTTGYLLCLGE